MQTYQRRTLPGDILSGPVLVTVTDAALTLAELFTALDDDWVAEATYSVGDVVNPTVPNGFKYESQSDGDADDEEPVWPTTPGDSVVDGDITWVCVLTRCIRPEMKELVLIPQGTVYWQEGTAVAVDSPTLVPVKIECTPAGVANITFISADSVKMGVLQKS